MIVIEQVAKDPISVRIPGAVRMTGLSRSRLYVLMKSGEIDYAKVGGSTLILVASLEALIERSRVSSGSPPGR
ncbi:MAG: helix-turn-helix domain-containing protein [Pseudomonadota bacterium]